ncbi:MAG: patatin-like phospholipase family protein [Ornithinibacter sp.]
MSTVFVLTGGGSLGVVQVGMLAALHDHGIAPDLLVGTSAGALNAAYLADPGPTSERIDTLSALWQQVRRRDVFAVHPGRWLAAAAGTAPSLFSDTRMRALVERHLAFDLLEDARIPVHVVATDLATGLGVALAEGPVVTAVLASAAVPGLPPPVRRGGQTLVDGGVGEFDAVQHAEDWGADDIFLLPAGYPCAGSAPSTALGATLSALSLLLHQQLLAQVREHHGRARQHVMPPLCPLSVSPADFSRAADLIERSHQVSNRWLAGRRTGPTRHPCSPCTDTPSRTQRSAPRVPAPVPDDRSRMPVPGWRHPANACPLDVPEHPAGHPRASRPVAQVVGASSTCSRVIQNSSFVPQCSDR